jgi:AraC family transcriptional regulator
MMLANLECDGPLWTGPIHREVAWRHPSILDAAPSNVTKTIASRWIDPGTHRRDEEAETKPGYYTVSLAIRPTDIAITIDDRKVHDGAMEAGCVHVSCPGQTIRGTFRSPSDFLHLHIGQGLIAEFLEEDRRPGLVDAFARLGLARDPIVEQLGHALLAADSMHQGFCTLYVDSIGQAIVTRLLDLETGHGRVSPKVNALPKWRLKRALAFIEAHLGETVTLQDLAASTGLTRMHFAAQFRVATGVRPHEYLLRRRIDRAQHLLMTSPASLADIALSVGFQTQPHFTTVFKRFTGHSPYQWKQRASDGRAQLPLVPWPARGGGHDRMSLV